MPRTLLLALSCCLLAGVAQAQERDRLRMRVVTINTWGLPYVTPSREARLQALGPALAALDADVVLCQEVWVDEDGEALAAALAEAGLAHHAHWDDGFLGSGLLIASRWPFERSRGDTFELAGKPHKPFHGDWYARKGVGQATLKTPVGSVTVASTHWHARYGSDEYELLQVAQAVQAADFVGDHGLRPPGPDDAATPPLILGGDLNCRRDSLPFRVFEARAGLTPVDAKLGIDWILTRNGGRLRVKVAKVEEVLADEVELDDGSTQALSDHAGVLAVIEVRRARGAATPRPDRQARWQAVAAEATTRIEAEQQASVARGRPARGLGVILLLASFALYALMWKSKGRARWILALVALGVLHVATWKIYVGFVYEPMLRAGLENARLRLQEE